MKIVSIKPETKYIFSTNQKHSHFPALGPGGTLLFGVPRSGCVACPCCDWPDVIDRKRGIRRYFFRSAHIKGHLAPIFLVAWRAHFCVLLGEQNCVPATFFMEFSCFEVMRHEEVK